MPRVILTLVLLTMAGSHAMAQEEFVGPASVGSSEPLFSYDDLERWKHGYLQIMPYYGGYHSFRPYNYKQVISQSQTAAGWGLSPTMPYSQQFWHHYEQQADLGAPSFRSTRHRLSSRITALFCNRGPVGPWRLLRRSMHRSSSRPRSPGPSFRHPVPRRLPG